jgi:hypothetical protein
VSADEITLTLPRERPYYEIARLVLGGLAIRLDLTVEHLDDLEIALASVLEEQDAAAGDLTVTLRVEEGALHTIVGPFSGGRLTGALDQEAGERRLSLRRLLDTVCDRVSVEERDGEEWIELVRSFEAAPPE